MTTQQKLEKIRQRCVEQLAVSDALELNGPAEAGWRSTIAAIDCILQCPPLMAVTVDAILAAWPDEVL